MEEQVKKEAREPVEDLESFWFDPEFVSFMVVVAWATFSLLYQIGFFR